MARRKHKITQQPMSPEVRSRFKKLLAPPKNKPLTKTLCGFPLKNTNRLWRWDTLEDVNIN